MNIINNKYYNFKVKPIEDYFWREKMGYIIAWLLGVPVSILLLIWIISHIF